MGLSLLAIAIVVVVFGPRWIVDSDFPRLDADQRVDAVNGARTAVFAALAGLIAIFSALVAWRSYRLSQRAQITDRLIRALELVGHDSGGTRIGGIYALERLAREAPGEHVAIFETLAAMVRTQSHALDAAGEPDLSHRDPHARVAADIQVALTVIGRRAAGNDNGSIDLTRADLRRADLRSVNLSTARLASADLFGADLQDALLANADLAGADLRIANLRRADVRHAGLREADLGAADLQGAQLEGADLTDASLKDCDLIGVDLSAATIDHVDVRGATMTTGQVAHFQVAGATSLWTGAVKYGSKDGVVDEVKQALADAGKADAPAPEAADEASRPASDQD